MLSNIPDGLREQKSRQATLKTQIDQGIQIHE
jgi:hypothetical protein